LPNAKRKLIKEKVTKKKINKEKGLVVVEYRKRKIQKRKAGGRV
jgi:hypothetical protein